MRCKNCEQETKTELCRQCGTKNKFNEEEGRPRQKTSFELYIFSIAQKYDSFSGNLKRLKSFVKPETENYHLNFLIKEHEKKMLEIKREASGHWDMVEAQIRYLNRPPEKAEEFFNAPRESKKLETSDRTMQPTSLKNLGDKFLKGLSNTNYNPNSGSDRG